MSFTREIITLQLGNFSNYVGTHWWNIQEAGFNYDPNAEPSDINHDILFREGLDFKNQVTYTPRLILVDQKNSLRHLPASGGLYQEPCVLTAGIQGDGAVFSEQNVLWEPSQVEVMQEETCAKPEFQADLDQCMTKEAEKDYDFSNSVNSWTDFMYARYHPRSITTLKTVKDAGDECSFDCFSAGAQVWKDEYFDDELGDKIRKYIEECNNCQGFQTLFDCTDGYSGLTVKCLEYLADEYSKTLLTIPIFSPRAPSFKNVDQAMSDSIRVVNVAMAYNAIFEHSSLVLPLSTMGRGWRQSDNPRLFPNFDYKKDNLYHSSAILATYLDTMSLRYRLKDNIDSCHLAGFCSDLSNYGRKLAAAGLALPFRITADQDLIDCLDQNEGKLFTQLSPNSEIGTDRIVQSVVVRGLKRLKSSVPKIAERQMRMAAYRCNSISEMFQLYFQCSNYNSMANVAALESGMETKVPYPIECFDRQLTSTGFWNEFKVDENDPRVKVKSMPVLATAQSSGELADTIESLHREASRIKIAKIHRFKESGFEADDYPELLNSLLDFKDNYEDNFEL